MPKSCPLRCLLLAGTCLCVYGNPVLFPDFSSAQETSTTIPATQTPEVQFERTGTELESRWILDAGAGGGELGPHAAPEGAAPVTQNENGDSLDGRSGPREAVGEAQSQRKDGSTSEMEEDQRKLDPEGKTDDIPVTDEPILHPTGGRKQSQVDIPSTTGESTDRDGDDPTNFPSIQDKDEETSFPTYIEAQNSEPTIQKLMSHNPIFVSSGTSTPVSIWGQDGGTTSSLPDPLLPEIGPNLMPREDGPESLWTEAARPNGADTVAPLSQEEATEGTMSSESLPLIFEPFEDVTSEVAHVGAAASMAVLSVPGSAQPPAAMATGGMDVDQQLVTVETDSDAPSQAPPLLMPDWTSPDQTSGAELLEPISSSGPSVSQRQAGSETEDHTEGGAVRTPDLEDNLPTTGSSLSSLRHAMTTVTMETHHPAHKSRPGLEEMDSDEEQDEDEDDENSEESVEDESDEDLTEMPKTSSTPPPYSLIPPPPVWVQRNQGLMRSWVELIREKAGYVSGMLAPVGIGITGALLIVGALYSIRMIHRKRRNSFKHQRRKVRQQEQPREPGTSLQDQAMLLADSSEDEF